MNLHALWLGRRKKWFAISGGIVFGVMVGACTFLRIHRIDDIGAYFGMASECHPVWRQLAFRRVNAGSSDADLLRHFPPTRREEFGHYVRYTYDRNAAPKGLSFTQLSVVARDGKLVSAHAGSCAWRFTFFGPDDGILYAAPRGEERSKAGDGTAF